MKSINSYQFSILFKGGVCIFAPTNNGFTLIPKVSNEELTASIEYYTTIYIP